MAAIGIAAQTGCAGHLRHESVGRGVAILAPPQTGPMAASEPAAATVTASGGAVPITPGTYEIEWWISQPAAEVIHYQINCGSASASGTLGETPEAYRTRRIAELRKQRDDQRNTVAGIAGAILGNAGARVQTPHGSAGVAVNGNAAGAAIANNVVTDDIVLDPRDVGAHTSNGRKTLEVTGDGTCSMAVATSAPATVGTFSVTRDVDIDAEHHREELAADHAAHDLRRAMRDALVAMGSDPQSREHRAEAHREAMVRLSTHSVELRTAVRRYLVSLGAETDFRDRERTRKTQRIQVALGVRMTIARTLVGWGADPGLRDRLRVQASAEEKLAIERRNAAEARAEAAADNHRREKQLILDAALTTRTHVVAALLDFGARARPAMPMPLTEVHGDAPFEGAAWSVGAWRWNGKIWAWNPGGWTDTRGGFGAASVVDNRVLGQPPAPSPAASENNVIVTSPALPPPPGATVIVIAPSHQPPMTRDHRRAEPAPRAPEPKAAPKPETRDHRTSKTQPADDKH